MGTEDAKPTEIRIIVAFESGFRTYQDTLAVAIRMLRPDAEVMTVEPVKISEAAQLFGPDVVIGSPFEEADSWGVRAWVEICLDPFQSSRVNVNGCYSELVNPTLDKLLLIIDEAVRPA